MDIDKENMIYQAPHHSRPNYNNERALFQKDVEHDETKPDSPAHPFILNKKNNLSTPYNAKIGNIKVLASQGDGTILKDITNDSIKRVDTTAALSPSILKGLGKSTLHKTPHIKSKLNQVTIHSNNWVENKDHPLQSKEQFELDVYPEIEYMPIYENDTTESTQLDHIHLLYPSLQPFMRMESDDEDIILPSLETEEVRLEDLFINEIEIEAPSLSTRNIL